MMMISN